MWNCLLKDGCILFSWVFLGVISILSLWVLWKWLWLGYIGGLIVWCFLCSDFLIMWGNVVDFFYWSLVLELGWILFVWWFVVCYLCGGVCLDCRVLVVWWYDLLLFVVCVEINICMFLLMCCLEVLFFCCVLVGYYGWLDISYCCIGRVWVLCNWGYVLLFFVLWIFVCLCIGLWVFCDNGWRSFFMVLSLDLLWWI